MKWLILFQVLQSRPNLRPFPKEGELDPLVSTGFESKMMKGRKHPGRFAGKTSQLPSYLEEAANVIVESRFHFSPNLLFSSCLRFQ